MFKLLLLSLLLVSCTNFLPVSKPNTPVILLDEKNTKACVVRKDFYFQEFYVVQLESGTLKQVSRTGFIETKGTCTFSGDLNP